MVHGHPVVDSDHHFIIDPVTRAVTNAESKKSYLIQYDHNSERFSFEIDREVEGHDMSLCNKIEIHYTNTNANNRSESNIDVYEVDDLQIAQSDPKKLVFTWLVSENATFYAGPLSFLILFACEEQGVVTYRWHTGINNSIAINNGMNNGVSVIEQYSDILAQWKNDLFTRDYAYEGAVKNGFKGTEEEWYEMLFAYGKNTTIWKYKQNKLAWVTEEDIDAMLAGTYVGTDDEDSEGYYPSAEVVDGNLIIETGGDTNE